MVLALQETVTFDPAALTLGVVPAGSGAFGTLLPPEPPATQAASAALAPASVAASTAPTTTRRITDRAARSGVRREGCGHRQRERQPLAGVVGVGDHVRHQLVGPR